jgi:ABC-2 type transport system ATP-binding protein
MRGEVLALVREERREGRTVIFSSHVLDEVEEACDRVGILCEGRLAHVQDMGQLRLQHRIRARLTGPLPDLPEALAGRISVRASNGELTIQTPGELAPLLGWLATLPLAQVRIEPVGLRTVYDQYHAA